MTGSLPQFSTLYNCTVSNARDSESCDRGFRIQFMAMAGIESWWRVGQWERGRMGKISWWQWIWAWMPPCQLMIRGAFIPVQMFMCDLYASASASAILALHLSDPSVSMAYTLSSNISPHRRQLYSISSRAYTWILSYSYHNSVTVGPPSESLTGSGYPIFIFISGRVI